MKPYRVTIHCADSPNGRPVSVTEIRRWHTDPPPKGRGWSDIGYHFVVGVDGSTNAGRPILKTGAHVEGDNEGNVGICLPGKDRFTLAQFRGLRILLDYLCKDWEIPREKVFCHYQFPTAIAQGKTCPNMKIEDIRSWYFDGNESAISKYLLEDKL